MYKRILYYSFLSLLPLISSAQSLPSLELMRTTDEIVLDGELKETSWRLGRPANQFWQNFPGDSVPAEAPTEIYMTYNDDYLYVGVICRSLKEEYVIPSLRRDYDFFGNDNISILFDTFNDRTNAFLFGMNPYGVRREALISGGGRQFNDFQESWDNKWFGEAKIHGNYWIAEFAIPFSTLRFQEGSQQWRFNSYRFDTNTNEISTWIRIPRNQVIMDLGFMGDMKWEEPLKKPGANISIIPYITGATAQDFTIGDDKADNTFNVGGDAKIGITSGLNLDLTFNPDFSQVEVDQQVTNLDRFEIFFPERRQFFLENADLFSSFGLSRTNPFFSRRIGVGVDTTTGQNFQNPIQFGARLSGKLNQNLRLGMLNMQTAKQDINGLPQFNYTVLALEQRVFSRSNFAFIFANKQAINPSESGGNFNRFNRVAGLEYRLGDKLNRWGGKVFYHHSFSPDQKTAPFTHGARIEYLRRKYRLEWAHSAVGNGFEAEVGFIPRRDYFFISPEAEIFFYPKTGIVRQHSIMADYRTFYQLGDGDTRFLDDWDVSERELQLTWDFRFQNNSSANLDLTHTYVFLLNDFDPTRIQLNPEAILAAGTDYSYTQVSASFSSDPRKIFAYDISPIVGSFFNGFRAGIEGNFTVRYQPLGFISINYEYNHIALAEPFESADLWLVGPRIDFTFSKNVFLTTFLQYNSQLDNLGINTRFQWRFKPVSDFFIVYTDNYRFDPFSDLRVRNRSLVAKLTYWLNI